MSNLDKQFDEFFKVDTTAKQSNNLDSAFDSFFGQSKPQGSPLSQLRLPAQTAPVDEARGYDAPGDPTFAGVNPVKGLFLPNQAKNMQYQESLNNIVGEQVPYEEQKRRPGFESDVRSLGSNLVTGLQRLPLEMAGGAVLDPVSTAKSVVDFPVHLGDQSQVLASHYLGMKGEPTYQGMPLSQLRGTKEPVTSPEQTQQKVESAKKELFERPEAVALAALPFLKKAGGRMLSEARTPEVSKVAPKSEPIPTTEFVGGERGSVAPPSTKPQKPSKDSHPAKGKITVHRGYKEGEGNTKVKYYTENQEYAKKYGDKIETKDIDVSNYFDPRKREHKDIFDNISKGEEPPYTSLYLDPSKKIPFYSDAVELSQRLKDAGHKFDGLVLSESTTFGDGGVSYAEFTKPSTPKSPAVEKPELLKDVKQEAPVLKEKPVSVNKEVNKNVNPTKGRVSSRKSAGEISIKLDTPLEKVVKEKKPKAVGRQQVVDHFRKEFKIPIRTGKFRQKALGIFKDKSEVIRSKDANDLTTISHELGHYIEKKFAENNIKKAVGGKAQKELYQIGKDLYGEKKPVGGYHSEGFAEFLSTWLTSKRAKEVAPEFNKYFESTLLRDNPELRTKLNNGKDLITQWREQGAVDRVFGNIDYGGKRSLLSTKEKIADFGLGLRKYFVDELAPLETVEKKIRGVNKLDPKEIDPITSPTMIARSVAMTAGAKARSMVVDGTFDFGGNKTGIGLREILKPVSNNMKDFISYSYAKRAMELYKRDVNPGISFEDAQYVVNKLKSDKYDLAHKQLTEFEGRVLDYLVDAGGMSREAAQAMIDLNPSHIPLKRAVESQFTPTGGKKLADLNSPIKRIKGSGLPIIDPIESIIGNTASIISFADKVRVGKALVELSEKYDGAGKYIEKIPTPMQATKIDLKSMKKQLEDAGVDLSEANMDQVLTAYSNAGIYKGRDNIVSLFRDGKREFYEVDKNLYSTLKGLDNVQLPAFVEFLAAKPARAIRLGATGLNAGFGLITNPIRDFFTFGLQSEYVKPYEVPTAWGKGLVKQLIPDNNMKKLYRRSGADLSQFLGLDRKQLQRTVSDVLATTKQRQALNIVSHPIEAMKEIFSITEAAPRLGEFEAAYKDAKKRYGNTYSAQVAGNLASSDVTVNFRRAGAYGKYINQIIPFWNAAIQGQSRFYRFAKEHPVKALAKGVSYLTVPTLGIWMMNKDKDWYREMPAWQRYGFWNIELGENEDKTSKILRIPKPFEWGNVFATMPEMTADYMYSKDKSVVNDGLYYLAENYIPIDLPPSAKIPIQLAANHDLFRDRPIDPYFEAKYKDPQDRYSEYTSETSKFLGQQFGMSPRKLDFLVSSSTGGLGSDIIRTYESTLGLKEQKEALNMANKPILGRLYQKVESVEKRVQRKEYEINDEYRKILNAFIAGREESATKRLLELRKKYSDYELLLEKIPVDGEELRDKAEDTIERRKNKEDSDD